MPSINDINIFSKYYLLFSSFKYNCFSLFLHFIFINFLAYFVLILLLVCVCLCVCFKLTPSTFSLLDSVIRILHWLYSVSFDIQPLQCCSPAVCHFCFCYKFISRVNHNCTISVDFSCYFVTSFHCDHTACPGYIYKILPTLVEPISINKCVF